MSTFDQNRPFDASFGSETDKEGVQALFRLSHTKRRGSDPLNVAKMMADTASQLGFSTRFVAGTIEGAVEDGMYDTMRGGFSTDSDVVSVSQNAQSGEVNGTITTRDFQRSQQILTSLSYQYGAAVDSVSVNHFHEIGSLMNDHREVLHRVFSGNNRPQVPVVHSTEPVGKVGNFVGLDMHNLQRVPGDVRELLLLQRRALREIGVTVLSVLAQHYDTAENGEALDVLNTMAVVMESHLETRIVRSSTDASEPRGFLSYFTCGDAKHPIPAARFFHGALLPEQSVLHVRDRGVAGTKLSAQYIEDNFDVREPLEQALQRAGTSM